MNRPITSNETESVVRKKTQTNKQKSTTIWLHGGLPPFKEELTCRQQTRGRDVPTITAAPLLQMQDYDGSNLRDGLELSTAIIPVHKEEGNEEAPMSEDELINLIDGVLKDDARNNDGDIACDYAELAKSLQETQCGHLLV
uniref:Uncharacterized protein n=1 Tax=Sus scrofa TaxID=9823 RepID=A0A8D0MDW8_PIG